MFLEKIKELLVKEKNEILNKVKQDEEVDSSGDEIDAIQAKILTNINSVLQSRDKEKLEKIQSALVKIHNNNYGNCDDCGDKISEKRLLINPHFEVCISCAEQREMDAKK